MKPTDRYGTPLWLFRELNERFKFLTDPCAWPSNRLNTKIYFTEKSDGLSRDWKGPVFMNPPYSVPTPWVRKAYEESLEGTLVVGLMRHDPSTRWWNSFVKEKASVIPIPFRLQFINFKTGETEGTYNFPSALVVWYGLWA